MTINFKTEEAELVAKYRLATRPEYYSNTEGKKLPITTDMEAFIITASQDARAAVIKQVREVNKSNSVNKDYNDLLTECLTLEVDAALAQRREADSILSSYDTFRTAYFADVFNKQNDGPSASSRQSRYGVVGLVGQALQDLSLNMEEMTANRDRSQHLWAFTKVLQDRQRVSGITDGQRNQIKSWAEPFGKYTNGEK